jgi:hypothetical protein
VGLDDVTASGVTRAIQEYDQIGQSAFLDKYAFGPARRYFLVYEGRQYDSKAIMGAAHGYDHPSLGPLKAADFSGGEKTVANRLRQLGFLVQVHDRPPARNPPWAEEELILALDLYLREGLLDDTDPKVIELSELLNRLPTHPDRPDRARFRNPNGVALKLANFAALDPSYPGQGMSRHGQRDAEVWNRLSGDEDALSLAAQAIRSGGDWKLVLQPEPGVSVSTRPVEALITPQFVVERSATSMLAKRREVELVRAYSQHLTDNGHVVAAHVYRVPTVGLIACDLFDETTSTLYEAKGDVRRESLRMAVGQLFDYRRFESKDTRIAVLLPRRPHGDLIAFVESVGATLVYRDRDGWVSGGS